MVRELDGGRNPTGESHLDYLGYGPKSYSVSALSPQAAYLVFSEVWYPGWRAWVDDEQVPIYLVNFAFPGVYLPPGNHRVTMRFDPLANKIGALISAATLMPLAAAAVRFVMVGRAQCSPPGSSRR